MASRFFIHRYIAVMSKSRRKAENERENSNDISE